MADTQNVQSLERGGDICVVLLDASVAFDRVWHKGLIFKLRTFGIRVVLVIWLIDYLTDKKQRVVIDGHT